MFDNERYITPGVATSIPLWLQNLLWYLIETMNVIEKDYLQIFELKTIMVEGRVQLKIIHRQEEPYYKSIWILDIQDTIRLKLYCIDNGTYSTMLLSEEY